MKEVDLTNFGNVTFGTNVKIKAKSFSIGDGTYLGDNVSIEAENVSIGSDCVIEMGTKIKGIGQVMNTFVLGDNCFIGHSNQILSPHFEMKDYSQLHNSCLCSGYKPLKIGFNCWIGQGAILNSFESLTCLLYTSR